MKSSVRRLFVNVNKMCQWLTFWSKIVKVSDAKSPVSGGRLPYLDVHYGLPYGRTYLPFSPFTYGASGGDRHTRQ